VPSDAEPTGAFLSELAGLATRLAAAQIAIYRIEYDALHFGSWTIVAGKRHRRVKVDWDGKESYLGVSTASFSDAQSRPEWHPNPGFPCGSDIGGNSGMLFDLVEKVLREQAGT
jgi:hypothetical protein